MAAGSSRSAAVESGAGALRPPPAGGAVPLVTGARLPLVFIVGGLAALGGAAAWLACTIWNGFPVFFHPEAVAVAHLWLPGFLLSVCLGVSYQMMPVVLGTPLCARDGWLWTHAGLHFPGVAALVWGLAGGHYLAAGLGGLAIAVGVVILGGVAWRSFRASRRRDAVAWSLVFSAAWLLATTMAGVTMALNRRQAFLPLSTLDLLRAHAHLGLAGYFVSLLQGVTFELVPMFTMGKARKPRIAMAGLLATQVGLPILAAGLAWDRRGAAALGAAVAAAGLAGTGWALAATLATRRRRRLEVGIRAFVIGMALLGLGGAGGLGLALGLTGPERILPGVAAYGLVVIAGGLSLTVLGMLTKILPFLVWMKAYGPRVGREPVPVATALSSRRMERLWLGAQLAGLAGLVIGTAADARGPRVAGGLLLAAGAGLWLANAARVLRHLRGAALRPGEGKPTAKPLPDPAPPSS